MVHAMRSAWHTHRHWLAAGFLFSTSLFLLLIILNWRSEQRGINQQSATGLLATTWDTRSAWSQRNVLLLSRSKRKGTDNASGIISGTTERLRTVRLESRDASSAEDDRRSFVLARSKSFPPTRCKRLSSCAISQCTFLGLL
jgi:hypothetical protein